MATPTVQPAPFPVASKATSGIVNNTLTTVTCMSFTDKLLITIISAAAGNKLAHWVHVPLTSSSSMMDPSFTSTTTSASSDNSLLPRSDLTATTVLGGTKREDEVVGQTLATTIASAILVKRPGEERLLVLGLGMSGSLEREGFEEVIGLILGIL